MPQWYVGLLCERQSLLDFLSYALQEPLCTIVVGSTDCYYINPGAEPAVARKKTSGYYLLSTAFTSLSDSGEVRTRATAMLPYLNALVKLKIAAYVNLIEVDEVFRLDTEGRMIWETATFSAAFSSLESKLQKAAGQPFDFTEIWLLAKKHPEIDEVLNYIANETNWFNLYKAYEIIKKETYQLEEKRIIRRGTLDGWVGDRKIDFEESANKERHSSRGYRPRSGLTIAYMSLGEAAQFVTGLFFQWSRTK